MLRPIRMPSDWQCDNLLFLNVCSRLSGSPTTTLHARITHGTEHYALHARWPGYLYQMRRTTRSVPFLSLVLYLCRSRCVLLVIVTSALVVSLLVQSLKVSGDTRVVQ